MTDELDKGLGLHPLAILEWGEPFESEWVTPGFRLSNRQPFRACSYRGFRLRTDRPINPDGGVDYLEIPIGDRAVYYVVSGPQAMVSMMGFPESIVRSTPVDAARFLLKFLDDFRNPPYSKLGVAWKEAVEAWR